MGASPCRRHLTLLLAFLIRHSHGLGRVAGLGLGHFFLFPQERESCNFHSKSPNVWMTADVLLYTASSGLLSVGCVLGYTSWIACEMEDVMEDIYSRGSTSFITFSQPHFASINNELAYRHSQGNLNLVASNFLHS